jgi:hypothetical protein
MATELQVWIYDKDQIYWVDVTQYVLSLSCFRGKSRALDFYEAGTLSVSFKNHTRVFDPTNTSSPIYGYVKPKLPIYVQLGYAVFSGIIDDWSLIYDVNGDSIASVSASEPTNLFTNTTLGATTFPAELSGSRISRVLNDDRVDWPTGWGSQVLDPGTQMLDASSIEEGTNVFEYLQQVLASEQGELFIDGTYSLKFHDNSRSVMGSASVPVFADDNTTYVSETAGSAIAAWPYDSIQVSYSTSLLYNRIQVNAYDEVTSAVATDVASYTDLNDTYYDYVLDGVLYADKFRLGNLATYIGGKYSEPEYRFNTVRVNFFALSSLQQDRLLNDVRLNKFARVRLKPNNTGSTIDRFVRIIGIQHDATPSSHYVTYQLESIKIPALVLDDADFGKLDVNVLGL